MSHKVDVAQGHETRRVEHRKLGKESPTFPLAWESHRSSSETSWGKGVKLRVLVPIMMVWPPTEGEATLAAVRISCSHDEPGSQQAGAFSEVWLRVGERSRVRRVMSSSCSQPSPTKE
jgi:hypothetical protein